MYIFKRTAELQAYLKKRTSSTLGYVPTMGALHAGHISLIKAAQKKNDLTICSIFVNPTQFNDPKDLARYPRTLENDIEMLVDVGCDILFAPTAIEIYPDGEEIVIPDVDLGNIEKVMEGAKRPGHFKGVLQVVNRLVQLVRPDDLYMGQKDYQQQLIISKLLDSFYPNIKLHRIETERNPNGLALSSRNALLSEEELERATTIYKSLAFGRSELGNMSIKEIRENATSIIKEAGLILDYYEVADAYTLESLLEVKPGLDIIICTAAYLNHVRLIDNEFVKSTALKINN